MHAKPLSLKNMSIAVDNISLPQWTTFDFNQPTQNTHVDYIISNYLISNNIKHQALNTK